MKRVVTLSAFVLAVALALAPQANAEPLEARASLDPATIFFGDPVTAQIEVFVDEAVVDPESVRIDFASIPFRQLSAPDVERLDLDGVTVLRERIRIACSSEACLPAGGGKPLAPQRVRVFGRSRAGRDLAIRVPWSPLEVVGRVSQEATAGEPTWWFDDTPTAVTYRVSPDVASALLTGLAAALVLVAAALIANEVIRHRRRRMLVRLSPLDAALAAARAALNKDEPERRTAAGALGRALAGRDPRLVTEAAELAWSEQAPAPGQLASLTQEVERKAGAR